MSANEVRKLNHLALQVSRTAFAEGQVDAGTGDGPELERARQKSRRALGALLAALQPADGSER